MVAQEMRENMDCGRSHMLDDAVKEVLWLVLKEAVSIIKPCIAKKVKGT
jgi:hypothetical protein